MINFLAFYGAFRLIETLFDILKNEKRPGRIKHWSEET